MSVWCLFVCQCDEYGCMELHGIYQSSAQAYAVAKANGWQCEDEGEAYNWRTDYCEVRKWPVE